MLEKKIKELSPKTLESLDDFTKAIYLNWSNEMGMELIKQFDKVVRLLKKHDYNVMKYEIVVNGYKVSDPLVYQELDEKYGV